MNWPQSSFLLYFSPENAIPQPTIRLEPESQSRRLVKLHKQGPVVHTKWWVIASLANRSQQPTKQDNQKSKVIKCPSRRNNTRKIYATAVRSVVTGLPAKNCERASHESLRACRAINFCTRPLRGARSQGDNDGVVHFISSH